MFSVHLLDMESALIWTWNRRSDGHGFREVDMALSTSWELLFGALLLPLVSLTLLTFLKLIELFTPTVHHDD